MYRIIVVILLCAACHSTGKKNELPPSDSQLPFLKTSVNPLLQNLEAGAAKRKLDSIWPLIEKKGSYVDRCSWLRCMAVVFQIENKLDSARFYADGLCSWRWRKILRSGRSWPAKFKRQILWAPNIPSTAPCAMAAKRIP